MKIKRIEVLNFKAVEHQEIDLGGCSAIVTAGNNKGKTSMLRGLIDRIRGKKPEIIVKEGEKKGISIMELTDGSVIEWNFTEKTERFSFTTKEGVKQTQGVLSAISDRYFGTPFDIDKFLHSTPKEQSKKLQKMVGLDFSEIDKRYKEAYDERAFANRSLRDVALRVKEEPIDPKTLNIRDSSVIKTEIATAKKDNENALVVWQDATEKEKRYVDEFNEEQERVATVKNNFENELNDNGILLLKDFFDFEGAKKYVEMLEDPKEQKDYTETDKPKQTDTSALENELETSIRYYTNYEHQSRNYQAWIKEGQEARKLVDSANELLAEIEAEKAEIINNAKVPKEFEFTPDGILFRGFPLSDNQLSSSAKYIAALKLGLMGLGEIRTMHFDASFLDKNSLAEVQTWADENDLQLLIERPDFDGGEIQYQIITK